MCYYEAKCITNVQCLLNGLVIVFVLAEVRSYMSVVILGKYEG